MPNVLRRTRTAVVAVLVALVAVVAVASAVVAGGDSSTVTRPRLEKSLPVVFSHLYTDQARLLGHHVTPASLHARAMCDKHGPDVADVGPGGDWVCLMSWDDPDVPMPSEGYGKFELNVHSNDCFTAAGPSKLTGFLTVTDTRGREVPNPVFEFDGCFDPNGDNAATGTSFPSLLTVTSTSVSLDRRGRAGLQVTCGTGSHGCSGTMTAQAGGVSLGRLRYRVKEEATATLTFPTAPPAGAGQVTATVHPTQGVGSTDPVQLPVQ